MSLKVTLPALSLAILLTQTSVTDAETERRIFVVREGASASLLDDKFDFKVLKLRGYNIEVKVLGEKRALKIGESLSPENSACSVTFEEIATETRLARFTTDC